MFWNGFLSNSIFELIKCCRIIDSAGFYGFQTIWNWFNFFGPKLFRNLNISIWCTLIFFIDLKSISSIKMKNMLMKNRPMIQLRLPLRYVFLNSFIVVAKYDIKVGSLLYSFKPPWLFCGPSLVTFIDKIGWYSVW